jgi:hypothetical protein
MYTPGEYQSVVYSSNQADQSTFQSGFMVPTVFPGHGSVRLMIPFASMNAMVSTESRGHTAQFNQAQIDGGVIPIKPTLERYRFIFA